MARFIRTSAALAQLADSLRGARSVALDTEFHPERTYHPELMLVQLRPEGEEPVLVDPLADLDLRLLAGPLAEVPIVLHGGAMDLAILQRRLGCRPKVACDTQILAGCAGLGYPTRLQELTRTLCGEQMRKGETLSDWSARPLSTDQLRYAVEDVLHLHTIRDALIARLEASGMLEVALACQAELVEQALADEEDEDAWRSVGGAHLLDERERAVLRELATWRQGEARQRNLPRPAIVSDAMLLDIARRQPLTVEELRANRRMPSNVWKREGPMILGCVQRGRKAAPPPALPQSSQPRGWVELVRAAARVSELESGVAAELLLPDRALGALVEGRALAPWRTRALGARFFDFLGGTGTLSNPFPLPK